MIFGNRNAAPAALRQFACPVALLFQHLEHADEILAVHHGAPEFIRILAGRMRKFVNEALVEEAIL